MDIYDTLPISAGMLGGAIDGTVMGGGFQVQLLDSSLLPERLHGMSKMKKVDGRKMRQASI